MYGLPNIKYFTFILFQFACTLIVASVFAIVAGIMAFVFIGQVRIFFSLWQVLPFVNFEDLFFIKSLYQSFRFP